MHALQSQGVEHAKQIGGEIAELKLACVVIAVAIAPAVPGDGGKM